MGLAGLVIGFAVGRSTRSDDARPGATDSVTSAPGRSRTSSTTRRRADSTTSSSDETSTTKAAPMLPIDCAVPLINHFLATSTDHANDPNIGGLEASSQTSWSESCTRYGSMDDHPKPFAATSEPDSCAQLDNPDNSGLSASELSSMATACYRDLGVDVRAVPAGP